MSMSVEQYNDVLVVKLPRKLVYSNAVTVREKLIELIESGHTKLSLNLNAVEFIDSSGLAVLVAVFKRAEQCAGQVTLLSPSNNARMLIDLTRLHQIFDIFDDQTIALEQMQSA